LFKQKIGLTIVNRVKIEADGRDIRC